MQMVRLQKIFPWRVDLTQPQRLPVFLSGVSRSTLPTFDCIPILFTLLEILLERLLHDRFFKMISILLALMIRPNTQTPLRPALGLSLQLPRPRLLFPHCSPGIYTFPRRQFG